MLRQIERVASLWLCRIYIAVHRKALIGILLWTGSVNTTTEYDLGILRNVCLFFFFLRKKWLWTKHRPRILTLKFKHKISVPMFSLWSTFRAAPYFKPQISVWQSRAVFLYSCRNLLSLSLSFPFPWMYSTSRYIGSLSKDTLNLVALHWDTIAKLDFLMYLIIVKFYNHLLFLWMTYVKHLSSAEYWGLIVFCWTAWTGQPQYVLWWQIAVKYKHLTHMSFHSQIHQPT